MFLPIKRETLHYANIKDRVHKAKSAATRRSNKFNGVNKRIFIGDKILIYQCEILLAFTPGDLSLQPIAAKSA